MKKERKKKTIQLAVWTWTWVVTLAIATFGTKYIWDYNIYWTTISIGINLLNGVLMILSNRSLFNYYDELERKVQLESMAFTLGLSVVIGLSYSLLDQTNLINNDAEIGFLVMFISITYMLTLFFNKRRYQ